MNFGTKVFNFYNSITNVYRDEEKQEVLQKMKLDNENLTEDFTAMVFALAMLYDKVTGEQIEILDFTHLLNKLVVQHLLENQAHPTEKGGLVDD